jgi:hypothetical protein
MAIDNFADEFLEGRRAIVYAESKKEAIDSRLYLFPRAELIEAEVIIPARKGRAGKYYVEVSEDLN